MSVPPFRLRQSPSGRILPEILAGYVLTSLGPGLGCEFQAPSGPTTDLTPFSGLVTCDAASTATSPDGSWSQDAAYAALQTAITAVGNGTVALMKGSYGDIGFSVDAKAVEIIGYAGLAGATGNPLISGTFQLKNAASCTLRNVTCHAAWSQVGAASALKMVEVDQQSTINMSSCLATLEDSIFEDVVTLGVLTCLNSTFEAACSAGASGTSIAINSDFQGATTWDKLRAYGCTFEAPLAGGTDPGSVELHDCKLSAAATLTSPCALDAATERQAFKAGASLQANLKSLGEDGDAIPINGTTSPDFSAETRGIICATDLVGNIIVTIATTGSPLGLEAWTIDCYNTTAHTVTVKFGGVTLKVLPTQAAGTGTRYTFRTTDDASAVVYDGSEAL